LLWNKDWSLARIAEALLIYKKCIKRYIDEYLDKDRLKPINGGSDSYLNDEKTQRPIQHLCDVTYLHQHQIITDIKMTFDISDYSIPSINKWLHKNRFSYKKPKGVPHKFDEEKQANFIEHYNVLKAALTDEQLLLLIDAVHPTQATKITAGWTRAEDDKAIKTTVNGESIIDFFNKVRSFYSTSGIINLILDGAGYHRSDEVKNAAEKLNIKLHYLPPYSPNLNPIERLWQIIPITQTK
jgi:transposase